MKQLDLSRPLPRLAAALLVSVVAVGTASAIAGPANASAPAGAPAAVAAAPNGYASTIKLNNCSASLVRFPNSVSSDRALMLTNGHCYEGGMPSAGQVLVDKASSRSGTLLDAQANSLGTVTADRLLYATMTDTDVSLFRLTDTYASISSKYGSTALTISSSHPTDKTNIVIPSSYWKRTWKCPINGFVGTVREDQWTWHDSVRYGSSGCDIIGGSSGSPVLDASSGLVVAVNNTINEDGQKCTLNNPCEVDANGQTTATKGRGYAQETYWFTTCLTSSNTLDLTKAGCLLPKPPGTPTQTPTTSPTTSPTTPPTGDNVLVNPGFESGRTGWTGSTRAISNDPTRAARTGSWKLWLGGKGSSSSATVGQDVTVPSGSPKLTFWLSSDTDETGSTAYDRMRVVVVSNGTPKTLATFSNVGASATYAQKTVDLSAYAGKSVTVRFTETEDQSLQTSWVVDDASLS